VPYVRTVKTASGARAVQIVYSSHRGSRDIEHIGSAHDDVELELLKAVARQRLAAGQGELDLGLDTAAAGGPLPITASRMGCLLDALSHAYQVLGFDQASGGDEVFRGLVLARIGDPVSKADSLRVLEEAGLAGPSYATLKRRLPVYAKEAWRRKLSAACAAHARLGRASLVLYDVSTLYFETDAGDGSGQLAVMSVEPAGQRLDQRGVLDFHPSARQGGQLAQVAFPGDQRLDHVPRRHRVQVAGHRRKNRRRRATRPDFHACAASPQGIGGLTGNQTVRHGDSYLSVSVSTVPSLTAVRWLQAPMSSPESPIYRNQDEAAERDPG
jgi:hypothetical protein